MLRSPARCVVVIAASLLATLVAAPAHAQWSRVTQVPITNVFFDWANADTIVAGVDTVTYLSLDGGSNWHRSARVHPDAVAVDGLWYRNGRLYAGTFGQGVFVSDDRGDTWQAFNEGLTGGFLDSQLDVGALAVRGDSIYASTFGAGIYVRGLAPGGTWHHFGDIFEPEQASTVVDLALGGSRLLASAGANGAVFTHDPGATDWTESLLGNTGMLPGVSALAAGWTGTGWIVGTNVGVFRSALGQSPWGFVDLSLGALSQTSFAMRGGRALGAFSTANATTFEQSDDDGASWQPMETLAHVFVFRLAVSGPWLYAAQGDGLWVRPLGDVSVPPGGPGAGAGLAFSLAGAQPVSDEVRLRFTLPAPGAVAIDVFDVRGRRVGERVAGTFEAGPHEVAWSARALPSGVYAARLTALGRAATVKLVCVH